MKQNEEEASIVTACPAVACSGALRVAMQTGCIDGIDNAYALKTMVANTKRLPIKTFSLFIDNASAIYVTIL
jgi:hypothetical protein